MATTNPPSRPARPASQFTVAAIVAATLLSTCCLVHFRSGAQSSGLLLLASAIASAVTAGRRSVVRAPQWLWDGLLVSIAVLNGTLLLWGKSNATFPQYRSAATTYPFYLFACLGSAALLAVRTQTARMAVIWGAIVLVAMALVSYEVVKSVSYPGTDTYTFETVACRTLLAGKNPYALNMPNVYGEGTPFYDAKEITSGARSVVLRGYSYPPLTLYLLAPPFAAGADVRYVLIAGLLFAGGVMLWINPTPVGTVLAMLAMSYPFNFETIGACWTEPLTAALFTLTVWAVLRRPAWWPWVFGLFLASKQYSVFFLPAMLFLLPRPLSWRDVILASSKALLVVAVTTLPLAAWNFHAYYHSTIEYLLNLKVRPDSLSVATTLLGDWQSPLPFWFPYAGAAAAYFVCYRLLRPSATAFCLAVAVAGILVFSLNKIAFANYYILPTLALLLAATAENSGRDRPHVASVVVTKVPA